ncbi:hypothetical protein chiPu_0010960 [Chiloscyllium punctatum]|uniref:Homeodomain-only protein n=2 Tax=Chiloscyllium punctatum TaxID=137246 RepID=A0A401SQ08_CHIPU|nr:hypothetical protein [Chiloscyllium punctatum]
MQITALIAVLEVAALYRERKSIKKKRLRVVNCGIKRQSQTAPMEQQGAGTGSGPASAGTMDLKEDQVQLLEETFTRMRQPDSSTVMLISAETGLSEKETAQWFKERYAKWRQAEGLPPECGSVKD